MYHKHQKLEKYQKHQKHKDTTKQKHKNANKRVSDFFPLRCFLYASFVRL